MSKILIETRLNSLKLNESHSARKGCLGRIEGICADYGNPTRNGRFYSRQLWEHVFNDELIKESLESKTLIGELDHPEERFEPLAKEACVVMTDYKFDDDKQVVYGGFDILDTPAGRILKSLLDYGCVMGVSSRGQGDIINNGNHEEVEPNTYEFACFDVVTTPAVATARQHVTESVKTQKVRGLSDSIIEQVNNSTTNAELDTILRVIESTGLSNLTAVKSAIKDKRKSIVEGKTISDKTVNDLLEAKKEIEKLQKELNEKTSNKTIREIDALRETAANLSSQVLAYRHRESRLIESNGKLREELESKHNDLKIANSKVVKASKKYNECNNKLNKAISENKSLIDTCESLKLENATLSKQSKTSLIDVKNQKMENLNLSNRVSELEKILESKEIEIKTVNESLAKTQEDYNALVSSSKEKLNESKSFNKKNESTINLFRESLVNSTAIRYGIKSSVILENISKDATPSEIESFAKSHKDKLDRYASLPFNNGISTGTKILSEQLVSDDSILDEELTNAKLFMELAGGVSKK